MFKMILHKYWEILHGRENEMSVLKVNAVYEEDMVQFLKSIEMLESIEHGEVTCAICGTIINLSNIMTVYPENGEIKICCNNGSCYNFFVNKGA